MYTLEVNNWPTVHKLFPKTIHEYIPKNSFDFEWPFQETAAGLPIIIEKDASMEMFESIIKRLNKSLISGSGIPRINITYDKHDHMYTIRAIIAGYSKDEVDVTIEDGYIIFEYQKTKSIQEDESKDVEFFYKEISETSFKRYVKIPDNADPSQVVNKYADGIMTITIPTKESAKPKKLIF